jgi:ATP-dependent Lon protease
LWRLQTVFNVSPEEAKAQVKKHTEEMSDAVKDSVKVIMNELEDTDKKIAFVKHIRETVKDGFLAPLPQNQLLSDLDKWTPENGQVPDYADFKKFLETRQKAE